MKNTFIRLVLTIGILLSISLLSAPHTFAQQSQLRILVTGFEPFGNYTKNPSNELVKFINNSNDTLIDGVICEAITLPVTYFESWHMLRDEIKKFKPDYILSFGYAPGSSKIQIEKFASNYDNGYADNKSKRHYGPIVKDAPKTYHSELPIEKIIFSLTKKGIPVTASSDAGGYICNHIFFQERHFTASHENIRSGFIHLPDWTVKGEKGVWNVLKEIILTLKK